MNKNQVYFLWGEEAYLIDREIDTIHARMREGSEDEVELLCLDGDDLTPQQLLQNLEFTSLFSLRRMVVIKRPPWLGKSKRKAARSDEIKKVLEGYLRQNIEGQTLVITALEHDGNNALVKMLDKEATVIQFKVASPQYITQWVKDECQRRGCTINADAVNVVARSGQDLYYLENLIEKMSLMNVGGKINANDVEAELENKEEIKVFKLTDALLNRNLSASFRAYYQLVEQGEHPLLFLYMIVRQFISLGKAKHFLEKGYNKPAIAAATGMKEFTVQKMMASARNFTWEELRDLFALFLQIDITLKSTSHDEKILMETMIIEICNK